MDRSDEGNLHALRRAVEQLELVARLIEEPDNVGLCVTSESCEDNRGKRRLLREADWPPPTPADEEIRAFVAMLEPLPPSSATRTSTRRARFTREHGREAVGGGAGARAVGRVGIFVRSSLLK